MGLEAGRKTKGGAAGTGADILQGLGIDQAKLAEVDAVLAAKRAEFKRVSELFVDVEDQDMNERIRHLINKDAAEELIMQVAGVDQAAIDAARVEVRIRKSCYDNGQ